jgi:excisionase family DNA binding protein
MNGRLLTADELADRWQVPKAHVYALTRRGEIPNVKLGRYYRYRLDQIEAFELGADTLSSPENGSAVRLTPRATAHRRIPLP